MIGRIGLLLGGLALGALLLEGGLRLVLLGSLAPPAASSGLTEAHPTRGWALVPGARGLRSDIDYRVSVQISTQGLRDVEHEWRAAPETQRVVVLGDSFMEAYQVELEESLPRRLDSLLPENVDVINLGVGGYGTAQSLVALKELGMRFDPDLVVLAFFAGNDVRNNSAQLEAELWRSEHLKVFGRPYATLQDDGVSISAPDFAAATRWIEASRGAEADRPFFESLLSLDLGRALLGRIAHALGKEVFPYDPNLVLGVYATRFDPDHALEAQSEAHYSQAWEEAWQVTQALILETKRVAQSQGAGFVLLAIPSKFQADPAYREQVVSQFPALSLDPRLPNERLRRFADLHDLALLDLGKRMAANYEDGHPPLYHGFRDRHWNAQGHDFAARELAAFVKQQELLR